MGLARKFQRATERVEGELAPAVQAALQNEQLTRHRVAQIEAERDWLRGSLKNRLLWLWNGVVPEKFVDVDGKKRHDAPEVSPKVTANG